MLISYPHFRKKGSAHHFGHEQDQLGEHGDEQQDQIHDADKGQAGLDEIRELDLRQGHAAIQHVAHGGVARPMQRLATITTPK